MTRLHQHDSNQVVGLPSNVGIGAAMWDVFASSDRVVQNRNAISAVYLQLFCFRSRQAFMLALCMHPATDQILLTVVAYCTASEQLYLLAGCSLKVMHLAVKPAINLLELLVWQFIQVPVF